MLRKLLGMFLGFLMLFTPAAAIGQTAQLPETATIGPVGITSAPDWSFWRFYFQDAEGNNRQIRHWLDVWKNPTKKEPGPDVVSYYVLPHYVVTWGRGAVLRDAFNPICLGDKTSEFGKDEYWVAVLAKDQPTFTRLEGDEMKEVKGLFANLLDAELKGRAQSLAEPKRRQSTAEQNIKERFQPKKRGKWIRPGWAQEVNSCLRYVSFR